MKKAVAGENLSVGMAVRYAGVKRVYAGKLLKPWTWLKFEKVMIVEHAGVDHIAVIKTKEM